MKKQKLKNMRLAKGITQEQIAVILCRDKSAYCRKERGEAKILMVEWQKMADYMEVDLEEIFENDAEDTLPPFSGEHYYVPISFVQHLQDYIKMLEKQNAELRQQLAEQQ